MEVDYLKIENLSLGMEIKNYKEVCTLIDEKVKTGKSKQLHLKELERFIKYHKEGQKFIIDEIFEIPKEKIDNRGGNNVGHFKDFENLLISKEEWDKVGVYCITQGNNIYIGSTITGFRTRFQEHTYENNDLPTKEMLNSGGMFEILWISPVIDEYIIRQIEDVYINYYKENTDWNVVNERDAWSYESKEKTNKNKIIKVKEEDYNDVLKLLKDNNIAIYDYYNNKIEVI